MHIRFLDIIYGDINHLIGHASNSAFVSSNLRSLRGLVNSLALAYSDQHCPEFLSLLTELQNQLSGTVDPESNRIDILMELSLLVGCRLTELAARSQP
jgi:hypothetical protein